MAKVAGTEFKWGTKLVANEQETRDKALEEVTEWLKTVEKLDVLDARKIWFAFFHALWMTDRVLTQHEFCMKLSSILKVISLPNAEVYITQFFIEMAEQWGTLDKWRIEKYLVLVRKFNNEIMDWAKQNNKMDFVLDLWKEILNMEKGAGLKLQFIDVIESYLAPIVQENTSKNGEYLKPYTAVFCDAHNQTTLVIRIYEKIVEPLIETEGEYMFGNDTDATLHFFRGLVSKLNNAVKHPDPNPRVADLRMTTCQKCREIVAAILKAKAESGEPAEKIVQPLKLSK